MRRGSSSRKRDRTDFRKHDGRPGRQFCFQVGQVHAPRFSVGFYRRHASRAAAIRARLRKYLGIHRLRNQRLGSPRHAHRHAQRRAHGLPAVVRRIADHVGVEQLAHHAGVFEDGLHLAVIGVGVAAVSGEELGAIGDLVAERRHVVAVTARAEKADRVGAADVLTQQTQHMIGQLRFAPDGLGQAETAFKQKSVGNDAPVNFLDRRNPQLLQHRRPDRGHAVGHVRMNERFLRHDRTSLERRHHFQPSRRGKVKGKLEENKQKKASRIYGKRTVLP